MKKVYQTIVDKGTGNCMQAAFASLFELPLEEVPHFRIIPDNKWFDALYKFILEQGYEYNGTLENPKCLGYWGKDRFGEIKESEGVNGYFYAVVYSPKYFDSETYCDSSVYPTTHAVIIDKDLNIVHDPNPGYAGKETYPLHDFIGYNGIKTIYLIEKPDNGVNIVVNAQKKKVDKAALTHPEIVKLALGYQLDDEVIIESCYWRITKFMERGTQSSVGERDLVELKEGMIFTATNSYPVR